MKVAILMGSEKDRTAMQAAADVLAEISADGTGINVRSRVSGYDFSIGENGSSDRRSALQS